MHADYGEKYTWQQGTMWLVTQHCWKAHPPRQKCMMGFLIYLVIQRTCSTAGKFVRESSKLSSSSKTPTGNFQALKLMTVVWSRAHMQMFESFIEQCLHPEMTPEINRELMKILEDWCSALSEAPASQEGSVCRTCLCLRALSVLLHVSCATALLLRALLNNYLPAYKALLNIKDTHPNAALKKWSNACRQGYWWSSFQSNH